MTWNPGSKIKRKLREIVEARDGTDCRHCGRPTVPTPSRADGITLSPDTRTLDHYPKARSEGGEDVPENLVISCLECNEWFNHLKMMETNCKYRRWFHTKGLKKYPQLMEKTKP